MASTNIQVIFEPDTTLFYQPIGAVGNSGYRTVSNICSSEGNYLFGSNGLRVFDGERRLLQNGDTLVDPFFYNAFSCCGSPIFQGTVIVPKSGNQYYVIYYSVSDSFWNAAIEQPNRLYYAVVDMSLNNDSGAVVSKRNLIHAGIMGDSRMTACRHANGRDWWLVVHGYNNNRYLKFLVAPDTITGPFLQDIGDVQLEPDAVGQAAFSSDGSLYASGTGNSNIVVLDFDRCSGEFSNPRSIHYYPEPPYYFPGPGSVNSGSNGLCFSPSGRFLYVNSIYYLHQYDLWADPIDSSRMLLGIYDSTTYECYGPFNTQYLMPNGKIFVSAYQGGTDKMSVITNPDSAGLACGFAPESFYIPQTNNATVISNMPFYELGRLVGSACDTLKHNVLEGLAEQAAQTIAVYPNPAAGTLHITHNLEGTVEMTVTNLLGITVATYQLNRTHSR